MAQWGREDTSVHVTGATTKETSNGAPIGTSWLVKNGKTANTAANVAHTANAHKGTTADGTRAGVDATMFGNVTPSAFVKNMTVGIFGVDQTEMQVNRTSGRTVANPGWVKRTVGTGGVASVTAAVSAGVRFANGETVTLTNGTSSGILTVVTNATGNVTSLTVTDPGSGWTDTTMIAKAWNHDVQWIANVQATLATCGGFNNTDLILVSNGTVNAVANINTDTTGNVGNASFTILTYLSNKGGLFQNTVGLSNLVIAVVNATYGTTTAGNSDVTGLSAKLANSSGSPTLTITLGGRAGRVQNEVLVAMRTLGMSSDTIAANAVTGDASDDSIFPDS